MRIEIATLFPEMCETVLGESIIGRARRAGKLDIHCRQIRDYTLDKHRRVVLTVLNDSIDEDQCPRH